MSLPKSILVILFALMGPVVFGQGAPDLDKALAQINVKYPPMETLEQVAAQLHYYDTNDPAPNDEAKLLEALKTLSNGYAANVHYKQAYNIFQRYLSLKEKILARQKAEVLAKNQQEYLTKDKGDADQVIGLQSQVEQLRQDTSGFISQRSNFKKIFSAVIVMLTFLFAISLVRSGVRLKKLMEDTRQNHDQLLVNHRVATLGQLKDGVETTIRSGESALHQSASETAVLVGKSGGPGAREIQSMLNELAKTVRSDS